MFDETASKTEDKKGLVTYRRKKKLSTEWSKANLKQESSEFSREVSRAKRCPTHKKMLDHA